MIRLFCALELGAVRLVLEVVERTRDIFAAVKVVVLVVSRVLGFITGYSSARQDWGNRDTFGFRAFTCRCCMVNAVRLGEVS